MDRAEGFLKRELTQDEKRRVIEGAIRRINRGLVKKDKTILRYLLPRALLQKYGIDPL